jgi:hypothetical protein
MFSDIFAALCSNFGTNKSCFICKNLKYYYIKNILKGKEASEHTVRVTDIGPTSQPNISS